MESVIRRSAALHLAHISASGDPFELTSSRPLDFGHWAAHKLEQLSRHRLRHGEAVAIGMALDSTYSCLSGALPEADWRRDHRPAAGALNLAVYAPELGEAAGRRRHIRARCSRAGRIPRAPRRPADRDAAPWHRPGVRRARNQPGRYDPQYRRVEADRGLARPRAGEGPVAFSTLARHRHDCDPRSLSPDGDPARRRVLHREPEPASRARGVSRSHRSRRSTDRHQRFPDAGASGGASRRCRALAPAGSSTSRCCSATRRPSRCRRSTARAPSARSTARSREPVMKYIDHHAHMVSRTTDDYAQMALTGCVARHRAGVLGRLGPQHRGRLRGLLPAAHDVRAEARRAVRHRALHVARDEPEGIRQPRAFARSARSGSPRCSTDRRCSASARSA